MRLAGYIAALSLDYNGGGEACPIVTCPLYGFLYIQQLTYSHMCVTCVSHVCIHVIEERPNEPMTLTHIDNGGTVQMTYDINTH